MWGVSAGGQLAAMHALAADSQVAAAVCWYTPSDLDELSSDVDEAGGQSDRSEASREGALIGAALDDRPDLVAAASPVRHVRAGAPPFLSCTGRQIARCRHGRAADWPTLCAPSGASASVELVDGATHMFPELDDDQTHAVVDRTVAFLLGGES